ncbi:RHS repeat-associated core domain-containing protein [Stenotrophomonas forensis]|uniref:RHS repeat-associated core domain-containing protein n=1 Tax=Stenotrophomonas forensis TaxID=2871169 RepID=UPI0039C6F16C
MNTHPCFKIISGIGKMHRSEGAASPVLTCFRGFENRIGKLGTLGAWLCCVLLIGLGVSPPAIAQEMVTYIHTDALGSVVAESDAGGNVIKRYDYEPYGAVVGGEVTDGPGYTGHVSDSTTGLSYMQQRCMEPQFGVFLSVDPVTPYDQPVGQFNRYRYANGNPYKFTDPDGRQSWSDFQTGFENGTLNASRYEHGFPLHANWAEQTGYALGAGIVKGGQSHAGGIRAPPLRMQPIRTGVVTVGAPSGRNTNKLQSDSNAQGAHSVLKRGADGNISNTATYQPNSNNPSGFQEVKRVDVTGKAHTNPDGSVVATPHVKEAGQKGVRPALPEELPKRN